MNQKNIEKVINLCLKFYIYVILCLQAMNQFGPFCVLFLKTQIQHSAYELYISPMIDITKSTYSTNAFLSQNW